MELKPARLSPFADLFVALNECDFALTGVVRDFVNARARKNRIFFIGNGGSAAIASHMAEDFLKSASFAAMCFNDGAQLTCLANDLGYERVFSIPLMAHGRVGDILVAISSSGSSRNILNALEAVKGLGLTVITLSGFDSDNPLRKRGHVNFYVPSMKYGVVEVAHLAILHLILDKIVEQDKADNALPLAHAAGYE